MSSLGKSWSAIARGRVQDILQTELKKGMTSQQQGYSMKNMYISKNILAGMNSAKG